MDALVFQKLGNTVLALARPGIEAKQFTQSAAAHPPRTFWANFDRSPDAGNHIYRISRLCHDYPSAPYSTECTRQHVNASRISTSRIENASGGDLGAAKGRHGAAHSATETGELACGNKPHPEATVTDVSTDLTYTTCRTCRSQLGLDDSDEANGRLEALFVISITLGLRPGELRKLTWDHVDLDRGVVHVWRSASKSGDTKTPKSKRSLELPKRAITALTAHEQRQARERGVADAAWHDNDLVFCHENDAPYTSDQLN